MRQSNPRKIFDRMTTPDRMAVALDVPVSVQTWFSRVGIHLRKAP
jgi:hypothetical protein